MDGFFLKWLGFGWLPGESNFPGFLSSFKGQINTNKKWKKTKLFCAWEVVAIQGATA